MGQGTPKAARIPSIRSGQPRRPAKERKTKALPPARKEFAAEEASLSLLWGDVFLNTKKTYEFVVWRQLFHWVQLNTGVQIILSGLLSFSLRLGSAFLSPPWGGPLREAGCFPVQAERATHSPRLTLALPLHSERACEARLGQATLQSKINKVCLMKCSMSSSSGCCIFSKYICSARVWFQHPDNSLNLASPTHGSDCGLSYF